MNTELSHLCPNPSMLILWVRRSAVAYLPMENRTTVEYYVMPVTQQMPHLILSSEMEFPLPPFCIPPPRLQMVSALHPPQGASTNSYMRSNAKKDTVILWIFRGVRGACICTNSLCPQISKGVQYYVRSDVRRNATSAAEIELNGHVVFRIVRGLSSHQGDFLFRGSTNPLE